MKKTLLTISIFLMFTSSNLFAAITASVSVSSATTSTNYPGYYDVVLHALSLNNTVCYGKFTVVLQRRKISPLPQTGWTNITGNPHFPIHQDPENTYSGLATVQQLAGTKYDYQVIITFDPSTGGSNCGTDQNALKTSSFITFSGAKPDFTLGASGTVVPNLGGPVNLCMFSDLYVNTDSCELETKYYMGVAECDLWWGVSGNFDWGHWYLTSAPAGNRNIQAIIDAYPFVGDGGFTIAPFPSKNLMSGIITNGPKAGTTRYYKITIATGEPTWYSKSALIRVDDTCKVTVLETEDPNGISKEEELSKVSLYPNPVKDNLNIQLENNQFITNVSVFDINKNLVKEEKFEGKRNKEQMNVNSLKKGIYFIAIETTTGLIRNKLVKE
ncbi:MAG: T9SS type A sorting domain-containing protein [Flavobacterium sp.]